MALVLALAGCAPLQVKPDAGPSFTIKHTAFRSGDADEAAREHCARSGRAAKHIDTYMGFFLHSRFECVPK